MVALGSSGIVGIGISVVIAGVQNAARELKLP